MPAAALIPSIIGGVGSLISGKIGSSAAKGAAEIQSKAGLEAAKGVQAAGEQAAGGVTAAGERAIGGVLGAGEGAAGGVEAAGAQGRSDIQAALQSLTGLDPYSDAGKQALMRLSDLLGPGGALSEKFSFGPDQLDSDKGFQFRLKQGQQAIERSAAARGTLVSGGTLKGISDYSQELASTEDRKSVV